MIAQTKSSDILEVNRFLPNELILEMVYVPVFFQLIAFDYMTKSCDGFAHKGATGIKKDARALRTLIKSKMAEYKASVPFKVFNEIRHNSDLIMDRLADDHTLYYFQYEQLFKNQFKDGDRFSSEMAYMAMAKDIIMETDRYDKEKEKVANSILMGNPESKHIHFERIMAPVNQAILLEYAEIAKVLGYDPWVKNIHVETCRKILHKQSNQIKFD